MNQNTALLMSIMVLMVLADPATVTIEFYGRQNLPLTSVEQTAGSDLSLIYELPPMIDNFPTFVKSGVYIEQGKHFLSNSDIIFSTGDIYISAGIWLFYIEGSIDGFFKANIILIAFGMSGCFELVGETSGNNQIIRLLFNPNQELTVGTLNKGWNWIAFGYSLYGFVYRNICRYSLDCEYDSASSPPNMASDPFDPFWGACPYSELYLGCRACSDSSVRYIIHSFKAMESEQLVSFASLPIYIPSNSFLGCGNLVKVGKECDDGNVLDNDGCSSACQIEIGYDCQDPSQDTPSICGPLCGDGIIRLGKQCDDANSESGDGCNSQCLIEAGYECIQLNGDTDISTCSTMCGDQHKLESEECDDGNLVDGDGCTSECTVEAEYECTGGGLNSNSKCQKKFTTLGALPMSSGEAGGTSFGMAGLCIFLNSGSAIISQTSPQSAMSSINMMQILLLLPLVGAFMPEGIVQYLQGLSMSMFNLPFFAPTNIPFIDSLLSSLDIEQESSYLSSIGLESKSSIINLMNLFGFSLLLPVVNLILYFMHLCTRNWGKWTRATQFIEQSLKAMKYAVYIRLFYEMYMFICLSIMIEFYTFSAGNVHHSISLGFACLAYAGSLALCGLSIQQWLKSRCPLRFATQVYFLELFSGVKDSFICRSYCLMFLTRRTMFVVLAVLFEWLPMKDRTYLYLIIQLFYLLLFVALRPFNSKKDNLIEIVNEATYTFLCLFLCFCNTEYNWNNAWISVFIYTIFANMLFSTIVALVYFIKSVIAFRKQKKSIARVEPDKTPDRTKECNKFEAGDTNIREEQKHSLAGGSTDAPDGFPSINKLESGKLDSYASNDNMLDDISPKLMKKISGKHYFSADQFARSLQSSIQNAREVSKSLSISSSNHSPSDVSSLSLSYQEAVELGKQGYLNPDPFPRVTFRNIGSNNQD